MREPVSLWRTEAMQAFGWAAGTFLLVLLAIL